jgi:hypothetical protein
LEPFKDDPEIINQYLPPVVELHKASFDPPPQPPPVRGVYGYACPYYPKPDPPEVAWLQSSTYRLLSFALSTKNLESVALILRGIFKDATAPKVQDRLMFYFNVLTKIQELLHSTNTAISAHPAIPHFFHCMIMKHIIQHLGTPPAPTNTIDLKLPQLKCGTQYCRECGAISIFLMAPRDETRTWTLSKANRAHVMAAIQAHPGISRYIHMSEHQPKGIVGTLTLKKKGLTHRDRANEYERNRAKMETNLVHLSSCLGTGLWRDRILGAVVKGGPGYTNELRSHRANLLNAPFPVALELPPATSAVSAIASELPPATPAVPIAAGQKRSLDEANKGNSPVVQQPPKKKITIIDLISSDEED